MNIWSGIEGKGEKNIFVYPEFQLGEETIQVDVQDTGYGIPPADLPFIFDRFYRVREGKNIDQEGNGLGLAIVKSITEQHGGQISVESEVDKGTRFSVTLPLLTGNGSSPPAS